MEQRAYPLRRGRSPARACGSPTPRRKLKSTLEDQEVFDDVRVATYNDNPEHLYGLDHDGSNLPIKPNMKWVASPRKAHSNGSVCNEASNEKKPYDRKLIQWKNWASYLMAAIRHWSCLPLYIIFIIIVCEVVICIDRVMLQPSRIIVQDIARKSTEENGFQLSSLKTLMTEQQALITEQHSVINKLNMRIKVLERNCSCEQQVHMLQNEDSIQKNLITQLQEQVLTTVNVVTSMNKKIEDIQITNEKKLKENENSLCKGQECQYLPLDMYSSIHSAIEAYHADVLALPDFALESAAKFSDLFSLLSQSSSTHYAEMLRDCFPGGHIHTPHHSETCEVGAPVIKVFGLPLWHDPRSPRSIISPDRFPGNCWPMKGSRGYIVIKLAASIEPTMVSLEHLDKRLDQYSTATYLSAPKDFEVHAWLREGGEEKVLLGSFTYIRKNSAIQTFKLQNKTTIPVRFIELRIIDNYGNPDCTCIYRFRVHGHSYEWQVDTPDSSDE